MATVTMFHFLHEAKHEEYIYLIDSEADVTAQEIAAEWDIEYTEYHTYEVVKNGTYPASHILPTDRPFSA